MQKQRERSYLSGVWATIHLLFAPYHELWRSDRTFKDTEKWAKEYPPQPGKDYSIALAYAKDYYGILSDAFDALDQKADSLVKHTSALAALIAVIASAVNIYSSGDHFSVPNVAGVLSLLAVLLFILAAVVAIRACAPGYQAAPTSPAEIIRTIEDPKLQDDKQISGVQAASFHAASVGLRVAIEMKARRVALASGCLVVGLLLQLAAAIAVLLSVWVN